MTNPEWDNYDPELNKRAVVPAPEPPVGRHSSWIDPIIDRPLIVTLCGSSRYIEEIAMMSWMFEKQGAICLSMHLLPKGYPGLANHHQAEAEGIAAQMDELHLRKIDLCDLVYIMNIDHYIGESTAREIDYARSKGKVVRFHMESGR